MTGLDWTDSGYKIKKIKNDMELVHGVMGWCANYNVIMRDA